MKSSAILRRRLISAILSVVFVFLLATLASPNTVQKTNKKQVFTDDDLNVEKVTGKLRLSTLPDLKQASDSSVPVVVMRTNTFYGQGKYAGRVKILEAIIENRSQKLARAIQLRWVIVDLDEPETVLLEGLMPFFDVQIESHDAPLVGIPPIYFNKIVKPLLKNDELNGNLQLRVGIQEVRFADGTLWRRIQEGDVFLKTAFSREFLGLKNKHF